MLYVISKLYSVAWQHLRHKPVCVLIHSVQLCVSQYTPLNFISSFSKLTNGMLIPHAMLNCVFSTSLFTPSVSLNFHIRVMSDLLVSYCIHLAYCFQTVTACISLCLSMLCCCYLLSSLLFMPLFPHFSSSKLLVSLYLIWPICPVLICYIPFFKGIRDLMIPTGSIKVWSYFNFSFEISGWNSILNFIWFSDAAL